MPSARLHALYLWTSTQVARRLAVRRVRRYSAQREGAFFARASESMRSRGSARASRSHAKVRSNCGACTAFILGVVALVLLPAGLNQHADARAADVDRQFQSLGETCSVISVDHRFDTTMSTQSYSQGGTKIIRHSYKCWDCGDTGLNTSAFPCYPPV